jgi:2-phospho-L-lactate guanylyltransferase
VVAVKPLAAAKSRLRGAVPDVAHDRLVLAMAKDTLAATLASGRVSGVLVVTDDPMAGSVLAAAGAQWVPDTPGAGLNAAFSHGARLVSGGRSAVAALAADLPALQPAELAAALDAASAARRAYLPDAGGTGTVLLTARTGIELDPRFGPDSAAAHLRSGALQLSGDWPGLRHDVDIAADLAAVVGLGLGRYTAELVRGTGYGVGVQGTVAAFDTETGAGAVLLDDGSEVPFPAEAFANSGLRLLRVGQRVHLDHDEAGRLVRVTLPTFR